MSRPAVALCGANYTRCCEFEEIVAFLLQLGKR